MCLGVELYFMEMYPQKIRWHSFIPKIEVSFKKLAH